MCEGASAGLLLTETMIQKVQMDMGDEKEARTTLSSVQELTQVINLS